MFDARKASRVIGFRLPDDAFFARVDAGDLRVSRDDADLVATAHVVFTCALATESNGRLVLEGARTLEKRFLSLFSLPPKASAARPA